MLYLIIINECILVRKFEFRIASVDVSDQSNLIILDIRKFIDDNVDDDDDGTVIDDDDNLT